MGEHPRVIGAGLPRTGTSSLKQGLERLLGGRCCHMFELIGRREDAVALGIDVPDEPFGHHNSKDDFRKRARFDESAE